MSSKAQQKSGYPLPETIEPEDTISFCVTIPNEQAYIMAMHAQLYQLGKWWKWKRDEDRDTAATESAMIWRSILTIEENCGGFLMTPEEYYDANRRALYDAWNDIAKQIVSGRTTNISVDDEGTVTDPTTEGGAAELPDDDPITPINETDASHFGAMISIATKLEEVIDKLDSLYGVSNGAPTTPEATAYSTLLLLYPFDDNDLSTAVSAYYAYRATQPQVVFNGGADFQQHMFCNGYDINSLNRFLINVRLFSVAKTNPISLLWNSLLDSFWTINYAIGAKAASTKYLDAACVLTAPQEHLVVPLSSNRQFFGLKANHNILLTFKGYVTDSDGDLQDAFWFRTAAGVLTRSNPTFGYGAGVAQPSDNEVPYNTAHVYQFTMQLPNASTTMTININENAGIGTPIYQADQFTIQFQDFGLPYGS